MRTIFIICLIGFVAYGVKGQQNENRISSSASNGVYISYGGPGIYFSMTYERLLLAGNSYCAGAKAGLGTSFSPAIRPEFSVPVGGFFLYGKRNSKLDLGLALSGYFMRQYDYELNKQTMELQPLIIPTLGYRYQKSAGGLIIRAGLASVIHLNKITHVFSPWVDLSIGYAF